MSSPKLARELRSSRRLSEACELEICRHDKSLVHSHDRSAEPRKQRWRMHPWQHDIHSLPSERLGTSLSACAQWISFTSLRGISDGGWDRQKKLMGYRKKSRRFVVSGNWSS